MEIAAEGNMREKKMLFFIVLIGVCMPFFIINVILSVVENYFALICY